MIKCRSAVGNCWSAARMVRHRSRACKRPPWRLRQSNRRFSARAFSLNMSTIRGQKLSVPDQVDLAAKAGYDAIEPWIGELRQYQQGGGSVDDLRKRIADRRPEGAQRHRLCRMDRRTTTPSARRRHGAGQEGHGPDPLDRRDAHCRATGRRDEGHETQSGCKRPSGFARCSNWARASDVIPQLEVWGFSTTLSRLGETMLVATESRHPKACVLLDVYHLYKGGSEFTGLAAALRRGDELLSHERLSGHAAARDDQRCRSRLSGRRRRAADAHAPRPFRHRLSRHAFAGAVQSAATGSKTRSTLLAPGLRK